MEHNINVSMSTSIICVVREAINTFRNINSSTQSLCQLINMNVKFVREIGLPTDCNRCRIRLGVGV